MSAWNPQQVLAALKAGGAKSLHLMEIVQILDAPKDAKDEVRGVLGRLKELGFVKELPGGRYRLVPGAKRNVVMNDTKKATRERKPAPVPQLAGESVTGWLSTTSRLCVRGR